jgi:hypothetical protein
VDRRLLQDRHAELFVISATAGARIAIFRSARRPPQYSQTFSSGRYRFMSPSRVASWSVSDRHVFLKALQEALPSENFDGVGTYLPCSCSAQQPESSTSASVKMPEWSSVCPACHDCVTTLGLRSRASPALQTIKPIECLLLARSGHPPARF